MKTLYFDEIIQPCWVCGKRFRRGAFVSKEDKKLAYFCFSGIIVCRNHNGAEEWYNAAIKMGEEKYRIEEEKNG